MDSLPVLVIPGWTNSGPGHWQSLWQKRHPDWRRVEQSDWDQPDQNAWIATLDRAISAAGAPPLLVAHSLGALTVAAWIMNGGRAAVAGALLVAPPDVERPDTPLPLRGFAPVSTAALPFASILVASRDDPYLTWERASALADAWGSRLYDAGMAGHLNTEAGFGEWPDGEALLRTLKPPARQAGP